MGHLVDIIADWFFSWGDTLIAQLPEVSFDVSALGSVDSWLGWVACYIDMPAFGALLGFIVGTEVLIWAVQAVIWLKKTVFV